MFVRTLDQVFEVGFRLLLWIVYLYLDQQTPYIRHIEEEELWYYRYPSITSIIPLAYLYIIMVGIPFSIYATHFLFSKKETIVTDIRNQFFGISLAYGINAFLTVILKLIVGRPRPNFFLRCFPDGVGTQVEDCTGDYGGQMDARKSFPSAHASFLFTGMVYVTCYIFHEFDFSQPFFARGVLFFSGINTATCRCDAFFKSDVIGGALIGTGIALFVFYHYQDRCPEKEQKYQESIRQLADLNK
ncbi:hypothetical protein NQ315_005308 [Exocentrus adspersus]|uniref:Phosphatidic acid phosphatase type 2/haloperoxidase domain-containing protein n=1 Tax=Exocentrus adspersus TaxID=1586481 RepID=A0AAV8W1M5_9CUCU|nr:hypothetical protein NQ315_005308 [Exocentrus adspersus]